MNLEQDLIIDKMYADKRCYLCGRTHAESKLNIEGHIHHGERYRCLNTKQCQRIVKKMKKGCPFKKRG